MEAALAASPVSDDAGNARYAGDVVWCVCSGCRLGGAGEAGW